jgi:hypothetical protein
MSKEVAETQQKDARKKSMKRLVAIGVGGVIGGAVIGLPERYSLTLS